MIIRTKTKVTGGITPDEKIKLDALAQQYIKYIERTEPIDKEKITKAIKKLYEVSGLKEPRVVIVDSPYVMALAGGLSAAVWYLRKSSATRSATDLATDLATESATRSATDSATNSATNSATRSATRSATDLATDLATESATRSATWLATRSATYSATDLATRLATWSATDFNWLRQLCVDFVGKQNLDLALSCIKNNYNMVQGGNMWLQYDSYLAGARDVLGLELPEHKNYKAWEDAGIEGGYRIMHEEFCIVSNFPKWIHKDKENRPHCATGSQMEWRDGFATYYLHGISFPKDLFEKIISKKMPFEDIMKIVDVDQRNQALMFVGDEERDKWLKYVKAEVIDEYTKFTLSENKPVYYKLYRIPKSEIFQDDIYAMWYTCPSTEKSNFSRVPEFKTVAEAMAWKGSDDESIITAEDWKLSIPLLDES